MPVSHQRTVSFIKFLFVPFCAQTTIFIKEEKSGVPKKATFFFLKRDQIILASILFLKPLVDQSISQSTEKQQFLSVLYHCKSLDSCSLLAKSFLSLFQRTPKVIIRIKLSVHNSTSREDYWHHQKVHNHSVKTFGVLLHNTWRDFCNVLNVTWWGINIRNPLQSFLNYLNSYYLIVPFHVTYNSLTNKPSSHLNIPQETISVVHDL